MTANVVIRKVERQNVPLLLEFIKGIARYEKMEDEVIHVHRPFRTVSGGLVRVA